MQDTRTERGRRPRVPPLYGSSVGYFARKENFQRYFRQGERPLTLLSAIFAVFWCSSSSWACCVRFICQKRVKAIRVY